ncbi:MAG: pilus assembly PilX N-terminal domain-containing protein [Pseudomonadales bacterium]|nr:pilus assembly PilX N-terminal domain-containing protein [Pseudomonadales bacterium]
MTSYSRQGGAALLVALMILTVVSILGVTAMKTSMFNAKIATTAQVSAIAFDGAESALAAVYDEAVYKPQSDPNFLIGALVSKYNIDTGNSIVVERCVGKNDVQLLRACNDADRSDSRNLLKAGSRTVMKGLASAPYLSTVSTTGGASVNFAWYEFMAVAEGEVDVFNMERINEQHFAKLGPAL